MYEILNKINMPSDIKKLNLKKLNILARDIRKFLVDKVSSSGGHLASNLGVVELTLALMKSFDFPTDSIVWDVGHQSYVYKILTDRRDKFDKLREIDSISGFPSIDESKYDAFGTGHASTSIAAANGIATAKRLRKDNSTTIAVIGDGALTGGLALESLNNLSNSKNKLLIIVNDNNMSIDKNVGITNYALSKLRISKKYLDLKNELSDKLENIPVLGDSILTGLKKTKDSVKQLFLPTITLETLGIKYYGPLDGHNIGKLVEVFESIKYINKPVVIHIKTTKGKGYAPAMKEPSIFHGIGKFDKYSGEVVKGRGNTYTDIFSDALYDLACKKKNLVSITAAMLSSTGLKKMQQVYPKRVFDVGIAEEYATTFAAGLASQGYRPVVCIYSTFLQRCYDQILHDVCIQNLPVIFAIDRAGIVGKDGTTHQGLFDISMLNSMPNMNIIAPSNDKELYEAVQFSYELDKPIAIRYPRGNVIEKKEEVVKYELGKSQIIQKGKDIAILAVGTMVNYAINVSEMLKKDNINVTIVDVRFIKPIDTNLIDDIILTHKVIFTLEEGMLNGGYGMSILKHVTNKIEVNMIGIDDEFVKHGEVSRLKKLHKLDEDSIYSRIKSWCKSEEKIR